MDSATEHLNAGILIVDSQTNTTLPLEPILRAAGYTNIRRLAEPQDACLAYRNGKVDLILLELHGAATAGIAAIDALRQIATIAFLPVLAISTVPDVKLRALEAGATDVVGNPVDSLELQTRIRNLLEIGLLHRQLKECNELLEHKVLERTAELRRSEARFQRFAELSSDWYWEQDASGKLTHYAGPVEEMLGIGQGTTVAELQAAGWNVAQRGQLGEKIANRESFLDFLYSRRLKNGTVQTMMVCGEPIFDRASRFAGYRGIGLDVTNRQGPAKSPPGGPGLHASNSEGPP
jgi:response regulator RpfG family c-di-GMP phosphodiesterase